MQKLNQAGSLHLHLVVMLLLIGGVSYLGYTRIQSSQNPGWTGAAEASLIQSQADSDTADQSLEQAMNQLGKQLSGLETE